MNVAMNKNNGLEATAKVEARDNTWVDELDGDRVWKIGNDLMGIMGQWEMVGGNFTDTDSTIKNPGSKHELEEVNKTQGGLKNKIEEVNYACRDVASKDNASLQAIHDEIEMRRVKE